MAYRNKIGQDKYPKPDLNSFLFFQPKYMFSFCLHFNKSYAYECYAYKRKLM